MHSHKTTSLGCGSLPRRDFLKAMGVMTASASLATNSLLAKNQFAAVPARQKKIAHIRGAFIYPATSILETEGYYSWPGSSFDAEGRQRQYVTKLNEIASKLKINIEMNNSPLNTAEDTSLFIDQIKQSQPDGLLLIPFKKGHWSQVIRIIEETKIPSLILATLGILLLPTIREIYLKAGVYLINSADNLDAVVDGLKMIKVARWMKDARIVNIDGSELLEAYVPHVDTQVRTVPHQLFYEHFNKTKLTDEVKTLANTYLKQAKEIVEPTETDIVEAAKTYFVLKEILTSQKGDALMMNCLPGLKKPHQHVPPCLGYMSLRDEGMAMGCESDLDATLTMMLQQQLFDRPAFQHNPSADTERNLYFGAHCTSASKMAGFGELAEPMIIRSHAEAGWGAVPRILFKQGQEITIAKFLSPKKPEDKPQMLIYSGQIVDCPTTPPTGGCRTNMLATINELDKVTELKGLHLCMIYGNYAKQLRAFCQLQGIEVLA